MFVEAERFLHHSIRGEAREDCFTCGAAEAGCLIGVRDEARAKGVQTPLMVRIPDEPNLPSAFWV